MNSKLSTSIIRAARISKRTAGVSLCVLLIGALAIPALADDFIVSGTSTTTNDGNTIDGDDSITITSGGSIVSNAGSAIASTGGSNTITVDVDGLASGPSAGSYGITSSGAHDVIIINGYVAGDTGAINALAGADNIDITVNGIAFAGDNGITSSALNGNITVNGQVVGATNVGILLQLGTDGTTITNNGTIGGAMRGISTGLGNNIWGLSPSHR